THAGDVAVWWSRAQSAALVLNYIGHNLALLALPVMLALSALGGTDLVRRPSAVWAHVTPRGTTPPNFSQALNFWIIHLIVAVGPPLGGLIFTIYMKTDWGIS